MRSLWSEPFLWIHLAGIVVFPLCLVFALKPEQLTTKQ